MFETMVDTRESWMVAIACCFVNCTLYGVARLSGLLLIPMIEHFNVSRAAAAMPFSLSNSVRNLTGPFAGYLGQKYGMRQVAGIGCILASLGVWLCFFAKDTVWMTVCWGIVFGVGYGLATTLVPVAINQNFGKYRSTASGISYSGAYIGSFAFPPLITYVLGEYGFLGAYFIIAGIVLNSLVAVCCVKTPSAPKRIKNINTITKKYKEARSISEVVIPAWKPSSKSIWFNHLLNRRSVNGNLNAPGIKQYDKVPAMPNTLVKDNYYSPVCYCTQSKEIVDFSSKLDHVDYNRNEDNNKLKNGYDVPNNNFPSPQDLLEKQIKICSSDNRINSNNQCEKKSHENSMASSHNNKTQIRILVDDTNKRVTSENIPKNSCDLRNYGKKFNTSNSFDIIGPSKSNSKYVERYNPLDVERAFEILPRNREHFIFRHENFQLSTLGSRNGHSTNSRSAIRNNVMVLAYLFKNVKTEVLDQVLNNVPVTTFLGLSSRRCLTMLAKRNYTLPRVPILRLLLKSENGQLFLNNYNNSNVSNHIMDKEFQFINKYNKKIDLNNDEPLKKPSNQTLSANELLNKMSTKELCVQHEVKNSQNCASNFPRETEKWETESVISDMVTKHGLRHCLNTWMKLFWNFAYIVICCTMSLFSLIGACTITIIGDFAVDQGTPRKQVHFVLMALSSANLFGTLSLGWITDKRFLTRKQFLVVCFFGIAVTQATIPLLSTFASFLIAVTIMGIFESGIIITFPLITAEYIHQSKHALAIASSNLMSAPVVLMVPLVIGFFRDRLGYYDGLFYSLSATSLGCCFLWILVRQKAS